MIGLQAKIGIESTIERVFNAHGKSFHEVSVIWTGTTAGVSWNTTSGGRLKVKFIMPALCDQSVISKTDYNHLLGYVMHELGHCWYTDNEAWSNGVEWAQDKEFMHSLINGLEDPRIEHRVIVDGRANNSAPLLQSLVESVLENGYAEPDDFINIPFMLAIEGRRLNGYQISAPSVFPACPWSDLLQVASKQALHADNTKGVVKIAKKLYNDLMAIKKEQEQQDKQQDKQQGGDQSEDQSEDQSDDQPDDQPNGQPSNEPSDKDGDKADDKPDGSDESESGEEQDSPREFEPTDLINRLVKRLNDISIVEELPVCVKTTVYEFEWSE